MEFKEAKRFAQGRSGDIVSRKHFVLARQPVARNMRPGFDIAYDVLRKRERTLSFSGIIDLRLHLWESLLWQNLIRVYRMKCPASVYGVCSSAKFRNNPYKLY